jgi:hypothetical protein
MGLFDEKTRGWKSLDSVSLRSKHKSQAGIFVTLKIP